MPALFPGSRPADRPVFPFESQTFKWTMATRGLTIVPLTVAVTQKVKKLSQAQMGEEVYAFENFSHGLENDENTLSLRLD